VADLPASQSISLDISAFNAVALPSPLPAAGAASAFAFSRRLRRRIERNAPDGEGSPAPGGASAYVTSALNLPQDALAHLPMSFDYSCRPVAHPTAGHGAGCVKRFYEPPHSMTS
jgi:hypothetical protein